MHAIFIIDISKIYEKAKQWKSCIKLKWNVLYKYILKIALCKQIYIAWNSILDSGRNEKRIGFTMMCFFFSRPYTNVLLDSLIRISSTRFSESILDLFDVIGKLFSDFRCSILSNRKIILETWRDSGDIQAIFRHLMFSSFSVFTRTKLIRPIRNTWVFYTWFVLSNTRKQEKKYLAL